MIRSSGWIDQVTNSETENLEELLAAVKWMRGVTGTQWHKDSAAVPSRRDAWAMEAYEHIALAWPSQATESSDEWLRPSKEIMDVGFQWDKGDPAAWYSGTRHAGFLGWYQGKLAMKALNDRKADLADELAQSVQASMSIASDLLQSEDAIAAIGRERLVDRWAKSIGYTVWAARALKTTKSVQNFDEISVVVKEKMHLPNVVDTVSISAHDAILVSEQAADDVETERLKALAFELLVHAKLPLDEDFDKCGLAGTIAKITDVHQEEYWLKATSILLQLLQNQDPLRLQNEGYMISQLFALLLRAEGKVEEKKLNTFYEEVLDAVLALSSPVIIDAILRDAEQLAIFLSHLAEPHRLKLVNAVWSTPRNETDKDAIIRFVLGFRSLADLVGFEGHRLCWQHIHAAGEPAAILWSYASNNSLDKLDLKSSGLTDVFGALQLFVRYNRSDDTSVVEHFSNFLNAVVVTAYSQFSNDDEDQIWLAPANRCDADVLTSWFVIIGIAASDPLSRVNADPRVWAGRIVEKYNQFTDWDELSAPIVQFTLSNFAEALSETDLELSNELNSMSSGLEGEWVGGSSAKAAVTEWLTLTQTETAKSLASRWMRSNRLTDGALRSERVAEALSEKARQNPESAQDRLLELAYVKQWTKLTFGSFAEFRTEVERQQNGFHDLSDLPSNITVTLASERNSEGRLNLFRSTSEIDQKKVCKDWASLDLSALGQVMLEEIQTGIKLDTNSPTLSVAVTDVPWWKDVRVFRFRDEQWDNGIGVYLAHFEGGLFHFNGRSPPIHEINARCPIDVTEENALGYLCFFTTFVQGEAGSFYLVDGFDDPTVSGAWEEISGPLVELIRAPMLLGMNSEGNYLCRATVLYGGALFDAEFLVQRTGMIEMLNDEPMFVETGLNLDNTLLFLDPKENPSSSSGEEQFE